MPTQGCNVTVPYLTVKLSNVFCNMDGTSHHMSYMLWSCMNLDILKIPCAHYANEKCIDSKGVHKYTTEERLKSCF